MSKGTAGNGSSYELYLNKKSKKIISNDPQKVKKAHDMGKLTAQERTELLFDDGKYEEIYPWRKNSCTHFDLYKKDLNNEGVITGFGNVSGRRVCSFSHDVFVMGASVGEAQGDKICRTIGLAVKAGVPVVGLCDASGARIQEGVAGLNAYCTIFESISVASGWIPQISLIMGTCAGGTAYASALTDFIIMVEDMGKLFITGPEVIKAVTWEDATFDDLGGATLHGTKTGLAHFVVKTEQDAVKTAQRLLSFLPANSKEKPPVYPNTDPVNRNVSEIMEIIPENQNKAYDMKKVIRAVLDDGDFMEIQEKFATNMIIGLGRINGRTVGIVANQPKVLSGCIDINASWKAARFVRFCDIFNIPLITLADCPGYLPGVKQEQRGIIRNGSKLLFTYSEATVPKITVVVRKDYGGAYSAMCGKGMGADIVLALPTAELAVMGAEGAVNIIYKNEIKRAADPEKEREKLIEQYREDFLNPYMGAEFGIVDDIIDPSLLREKLNTYLNILAEKDIWRPFKKHSNIPL